MQTVLDIGVDVAKDAVVVACARQSFAALIARYIAHEQARLHPYKPLSAQQRKLDRLLKRRAKLVALKTALRLSLQDAPELRAQLKAAVRHFDLLLKAIESQIAALMQQLFPKQLARLQTILGVGPLVGTSLAQALSRLPFANVQAFIAFTGLDPRPQDSGRHKGRRRLSKRGPAELRRLLFNAAMSAAKTRLWKPLYQHYRDRGWSSTATLVILARKLARIAYALWHGQSEFDPTRLVTA